MRAFAIPLGEALPKPVTAAPPAAKEPVGPLEAPVAIGVLALADVAEADSETFEVVCSTHCA